MKDICKIKNLPISLKKRVNDPSEKPVFNARKPPFPWHGCVKTWIFHSKHHGKTFHPPWLKLMSSCINEFFAHVYLLNQKEKPAHQVVSVKFHWATAKYEKQVLKVLKTLLFKLYFCTIARVLWPPLFVATAACSCSQNAIMCLSVRNYSVFLTDNRIEILKRLIVGYCSLPIRASDGRLSALSHLLVL